MLTMAVLGDKLLTGSIDSTVGVWGVNRATGAWVASAGAGGAARLGLGQPAARLREDELAQVGPFDPLEHDVHGRVQLDDVDELDDVPAGGRWIDAHLERTLRRGAEATASFRATEAALRVG